MQFTGVEKVGSKKPGQLLLLHTDNTYSFFYVCIHVSPISHDFGDRQTQTAPNNTYKPSKSSPGLATVISLPLNTWIICIICISIIIHLQVVTYICIICFTRRGHSDLIATEHLDHMYHMYIHNHPSSSNGLYIYHMFHQAWPQ